MCQSVRDIDEREESDDEVDLVFGDLSFDDDFGEPLDIEDFFPGLSTNDSADRFFSGLPTDEIAAILNKLGFSEEDYQNKTLNIQDLQLILSTAQQEERKKTKNKSNELRQDDINQDTDKKNVLTGLDTSGIEKIINLKRVFYESKYKILLNKYIYNSDSTPLERNFPEKETIYVEHFFSNFQLWELIKEEYGCFPSSLYSSDSEVVVWKGKETLKDYILSCLIEMRNRYKNYFEVGGKLKFHFHEIINSYEILGNEFLEWPDIETLGEIGYESFYNHLYAKAPQE